MSSRSPYPRWTPPIPPVANTRKPACAAISIVELTVVAAEYPAWNACPRFAVLTFGTSPPSIIDCSSARFIPTVARPSTTPINAGVESSARTIASSSSASRRLALWGTPWTNSVVSNATARELTRLSTCNSATFSQDNLLGQHNPIQACRKHSIAANDDDKAPFLSPCMKKRSVNTERF